MEHSELAVFLAHSVELESEAHERYLELADAMATHHNTDVAQFFRRMAREAELHLAEVNELAGDLPLPQLKAWDFQWPGSEPPETANYEALHYRMSLREAMNLALANEQAAERYYRQAARAASDARNHRGGQRLCRRGTRPRRRARAPDWRHCRRSVLCCGSRTMSRTCRNRPCTALLAARGWRRIRNRTALPAHSCAAH